MEELWVLFGLKKTHQTVVNVNGCGALADKPWKLCQLQSCHGSYAIAV
jgi:hypothetical protein